MIILFICRPSPHCPTQFCHTIQRESVRPWHRRGMCSGSLAGAVSCSPFQAQCRIHICRDRASDDPRGQGQNEVLQRFLEFNGWLWTSCWSPQECEYMYICFWSKDVKNMFIYHPPPPPPKKTHIHTHTHIHIHMPIQTQNKILKKFMGKQFYVGTDL